MHFTAGGRSVRELASLGYHCVNQTSFTGSLFLELWARSGASLGEAWPVGTGFPRLSAGVPGWSLPAGSRVGASGPEDELVLRYSGSAEERAVTLEKAETGDLFSLQLEARSRLTSGALRIFLICTSQSGAFLGVAPNGAGGTVQDDGRWHALQIVVQCPSETRGLLVDLLNSGRGIVAFRNVRLQLRRPAITPLSG